VFTKTGLDSTWIDLLEGNQITTPSAIQHLAIAPILQGQDVLVQSPTGSGKTLAYLLPACQRIDEAARQLQVLVIVPSREMETYAVAAGLRAISLIGNAAVKRQIEKLKEKPHIAVGTPGRIVELMEAKKLSLHHVRTIILDEADQLFTLGSGKDLERIMKATLRDRQTVAVSATLSEPSKKALGSYMKPGALVCRVDVQTHQAETAGTVKHGFFLADTRDQIDMLRKYVHADRVKSAIIFVSDPNRIIEVADKLSHHKLAAAPLYGEAGKNERAAVLQAFRQGKVQYLVTTDVASRGLDFDQVTHVIQLDIPRKSEGYIHRAGRTGRMGKSGTVVSIVAKFQVSDLKRLVKQAGFELEPWVLQNGKVQLLNRS
jgi:superfamily II DNA/RNA helicase